MLELLAPAGDMEALHAAVQNGADAVYLGCEDFNARQGAKNFTTQELAEAVKYCHIRGVKVHLTLNTLISDRELPEVAELIRLAAESGVDAFIVQDLGVVSLCQQIAPEIDIHGSTQMTVCSLSGVQLCAALGLTRVVLARELSREEIRHICQNSPIEIEVFGHGALCMCYSGQCYLSAMIGCRSGNRGKCAQPCRQTYGYGRWQDRHPLSLKDNCLIRYVKELEAMGVASLKLEGRKKRPEYVAAVTGVYRQALDTGAMTREMMDTLFAAFNRQGFTDGYYSGILDEDMFGWRDLKSDSEAWHREIRKTYEGVENPRVPVKMMVTVHPGLTSLTVKDPQGRIATVNGPAPEPARTVELTQDALIARLSKTGGTPYRCTGVQCSLTPGLSLSVAAVNSLRRDALNLLTAQRGRSEIPALGKAKKPITYPGSRKMPVLTVQVTTREQLTPGLLEAKPAVLYIPLHILIKDLEYAATLAATQQVCAVLPRIVRDPEMEKLRSDLLAIKQAGVREALVGNLGLLLPVRAAGLRIRGDLGLNLYNSGSVNFMRDMELRSACLSMEMTLPQIRDISKAVPCELPAYGRLPLMITENCLIRGRNGNCTCHLSGTKLTDQTGADFPIIRDGDTCRSILLNGKKLYWLDRQDDLMKLGLWAIRLMFTTENAQETDRIVAAYDNPAPFDPGACTRGLYLRGLD